MRKLLLRSPLARGECAKAHSLFSPGKMSLSRPAAGGVSRKRATFSMIFVAKKHIFLYNEKVMFEKMNIRTYVKNKENV